MISSSSPLSHTSKMAGRINELTTVSKIKFGHTELVRLLLENGGDLANTLLSDVETIHYICWQIFTLGHHSYLVFMSNYNGSFDKYIDDFASKLTLGLGLEAIWANCEDWPGLGSVEGLKDFIRRTTIGADFYYAACPDATVRDIMRGLRAARVAREYFDFT
jgi:hypothetical protein